jgi:hypothetical protein
LKQQKEKNPNERACQGCKLGYEAGKRDLSRAKCKIKVCCFVERELETCADCPNYPCEILGAFWNKKGWKYKQYRKQLVFIRQNGYDEFLKRADEWKGPFGRLKSG